LSVSRPTLPARSRDEDRSLGHRLNSAIWKIERDEAMKRAAPRRSGSIKNGIGANANVQHRADEMSKRD